MVDRYHDILIHFFNLGDLYLDTFICIRIAPFTSSKTSFAMYLVMNMGDYPILLLDTSLSRGTMIFIAVLHLTVMILSSIMSLTYAVRNN